MSRNKIVIEIADKVATCLTKKSLVCGNSKYVAEFVFDEEWNEHDVKTAVFKANGSPFHVVFSGNSCKIPVVKDTLSMTVGVFAGTIDDGTLSTSTPALVKCRVCATDGEATPAAPQDDTYNQIVRLCNEAVETAKSVEDRANNGEFDGEKGDKGDKGDKGAIDQETLDDINNRIDHKLDKKTTTGGMSAYTVMGTTQNLTKVEYDTVGSSIARRTSSGQLKANPPKEDKDLTTKKYVDDLVGNVENTANDAFENASSARANSEMNEQKIESLNNEVSILWEHVDANTDKITNLETQMGDIETALDAIIEIQGNLIGE